MHLMQCNTTIPAIKSTFVKLVKPVKTETEQQMVTFTPKLVIVCTNNDKCKLLWRCIKTLHDCQSSIRKFPVNYLFFPPGGSLHQVSFQCKDASDNTSVLALRGVYPEYCTWHLQIQNELSRSAVVLHVNSATTRQKQVRFRLKTLETDLSVELSYTTRKETGDEGST